MNKKNGFTLIELLAVIVILAVLGLIAIPTIIDSINESKRDLYVEQVNQILDAAEGWAAANDSKLPDASSTSTPIRLEIETLKKSGNLKNEKIKNPIDGSKEMNGYVAIKYDSEYKQYVNVYCDANETYAKIYYEDSTEYNSVKTTCSKATKVVS